MVVGTLSFMQKGQTSGFSRCSHTVDTVHSGYSGCMYTVDAVDAVRSGRSRIVVYGGGDIVFCGKRSNQRLQWMQYAVDKWYMVVGYCPWCKKVKPVDAVDAVTQWTQYTVDAVCSGCSLKWMQ